MECFVFDEKTSAAVVHFHFLKIDDSTTTREQEKKVKGESEIVAQKKSKKRIETYRIHVDFPLIGRSFQNNNMEDDRGVLLNDPPSDGISSVKFSGQYSNYLLVSSWDSVSFIRARS
jgi:hypothetical protein